MKFRAQLIQANDRFGFANFKQYQERKGKLITDNSLIAPLAISRTLDEQKFIKSIEARIIPRKKERELYAQVIALDKRISVKEQLNQKYYYVLHIPKYKDSFEPMEGGVFTNLDIYCRHYKLRKSLLEYYVGIRMVLENHANMGDRIKGIDACSNEIGCRPEVFGQFYRAVKNTRFVIKSDACATTNNEVYLKATYHVGEDFLDPIDGLRSVEEALIFLNLSNGDRIGHGTVLGINIERWYDEKNWCVHLRSQDLLDNLCWMLRKAQKNDIYIEESQRQEIESYIKMLYIEIYLNSDINSSETYVEEYYYFAWLLRGDNPLIYEELSVNIVGLFNEWDEAATNIIEEADLKQIRKLMPVVQLIRKYHYNKEVKLAGNRAKEYTIPRVFSEILEKLQKVLCEEICNKNIFIEANPTSNVLINNFKRYEDHPIYNLSNRGLKGNNKTDVKVTINTDDQGVFNNSLENEYALIYSALTRSDRYMTQYDKNDIESWIASIRENGLDATFN